MSEWISVDNAKNEYCSEKLPEAPMEVLGCWGSSVALCYYDEMNDRWAYIRRLHDDVKDALVDPDYWMPLPSQPEQE